MGGEKYELFHSEHLTIMILCICLIVAGCILYRRLSSSGKPVMRRCMAAGMILLIALRQLYVCLAGDNMSTSERLYRSMRYPYLDRLYLRF